MKLMTTGQFNFKVKDEHELISSILNDLSKSIEEEKEKLIESVRNDIINAFLQGVEMHEMFNGEGRCFLTDAEKLADALILKYQDDYNETFKTDKG